jgi:hypothetical protein
VSLECKGCHSPPAGAMLRVLALAVLGAATTAQQGTPATTGVQAPLVNFKRVPGLAGRLAARPPTPTADDPNDTKTQKTQDLKQHCSSLFNILQTKAFAVSAAPNHPPLRSPAVTVPTSQPPLAFRPRRAHGVDLRVVAARLSPSCGCPVLHRHRKVARRSRSWCNTAMTTRRMPIFPSCARLTRSATRLAWRTVRLV